MTVDAYSFYGEDYKNNNLSSNSSLLSLYDEQGKIIKESNKIWFNLINLEIKDQARIIFFDCGFLSLWPNESFYPSKRQI